MLREGTLLTTDYGVYKVENLPVGIKVPTTEGWRNITHVWKSRPFNRKFKIVTEIGAVFVDEHQYFFQDNKRTNLFRINVGSKINTFYGEKEILKKIPFIEKKRYYKIRTNNYNSNYYIHNGILLCY